MHLSFSKETNVAPNRYVISSRYISNDISRRSEGQRQFVSVTLVSRRRNSFFFSFPFFLSPFIYISDYIAFIIPFRSTIDKVQVHKSVENVILPYFITRVIVHQHKLFVYRSSVNLVLNFV